MKNISRDVLFTNFNEVFVSYTKNYINTPNSRSQSTMIYHPNSRKFFLFGGLNSERYNDMWTCEYNNDTNNFLWTKLKPKGEIPMTRNGHTAVLYRNEMFIFGGTLEDEKVYKIKEDVLIYDVIANKFLIETCFNKKELKWRRNHIAESIGNHMLIYGGIDEEGKYLSDMWLLDYVNLRWIRMDPKGPKFPALAYHSSCLVVANERKQLPNFTIFKKPEIPINKLQNRNLKLEGVYIFGGLDEDYNYKNDVYVIKVGMKPLEKLQLTVSGTPPFPRTGCSMNFYEPLNSIIIHGGRNDKHKKGTLFNDVWILDVEKFNWIKIYTNDGYSRVGLEFRSNHCSIIKENKLIIFGGINAKNFLSSELCILELDLIENNRRKQSMLKANILNSNTMKNEDLLKNSLKNIEVEESEKRKVTLDTQSVFESFLEKGDKLYEKMNQIRGKSLGSG
jgi:hypothetical protein